MVTLRYGLTKFIDNNTLSVEYDPAHARLQPDASCSAIQVKKFPQCRR